MRAPAPSWADKSEAKSLLVVTLRRLGDVLLTTPLLATLRRHFPEARIDALVFAGTEGMLAGNRDVDAVLTLPLKPRLADLMRLRREHRYDIALSTQSGDRPVGLAALLGRHSVGLVGADAAGGWWKRAVLSAAVAEDASEHRVINLARLSDALACPRHLALVAPTGDAPSGLFPTRPYAVLHANPMYPYRRWHRPGWIGLAKHLAARGLALVATGGPGADERAYLDDIWNAAGVDILRLDGRLDFIANTALLSGAAVYVGLDTSMSHLAAAANCPTVALYGPASPHDIGPWPAGAVETPWKPSGAIQRLGRVAVVQKPLYCLPCARTGCDNHRLSRSRCLDELPLATVIAAIDQVMAAS